MSLTLKVGHIGNSIFASSVMTEVLLYITQQWSTGSWSQMMHVYHKPAQTAQLFTLI